MIFFTILIIYSHFQLNIGEVFGCRECIFRSYKNLEIILKYLPVHIPVVFVSGFLYLKVNIQLRQSRNNRKQTLTVAFMVLWVSWIACSAPFGIYDVFLELKDIKGVLDEDLFTLLQRATSTREDIFDAEQIYVILTALRSLKHFYGFINSVCLIVLLRPLQAPLRKAGDKLQNMCCRSKQ